MPAEATGIAGTLKDEGRHIADDLKQQGGKALDSAKDAGSSLVQQQKEKLASCLDEYAGARKAAGESLQSEEGNPLAGPADRASRKVKELADYFHDKAPGDCLGDLENLARRKPELFFGAAFVAGLATVRFLKASARNSGSGRSANSHSAERPPSVPPVQREPRMPTAEIEPQPGNPPSIPSGTPYPAMIP